MKLLGCKKNLPSGYKTDSTTFVTNFFFRSAPNGSTFWSRSIGATLPRCTCSARWRWRTTFAASFTPWPRFETSASRASPIWLKNSFFWLRIDRKRPMKWCHRVSPVIHRLNAYVSHRFRLLFARSKTKLFSHKWVSANYFTCYVKFCQIYD